MLLVQNERCFRLTCRCNGIYGILSDVRVLDQDGGCVAKREGKGQGSTGNYPCLCMPYVNILYIYMLIYSLDLDFSAVSTGDVG